jgi:hypothetical protein
MTVAIVSLVRVSASAFHRGVCCVDIGSVIRRGIGSCYKRHIATTFQTRCSELSLLYTTFISIRAVLCGVMCDFEV